MTGRDTCNGTCETAAGCNCNTTCCTGRCDQGRACVTQYPRPMPRVIPCSTVARWYLAMRRWLLG
jgi:hypothetical protein